MWEFFEWSHPSDGWPNITGALKPRKDEFGNPQRWAIFCDFSSFPPSSSLFWTHLSIHPLSMLKRWILWSQRCAIQNCLSACLERRYHFAWIDHTNTHRDLIKGGCENCAALPQLSVCLRPFLSGLLCPYVLIQLCSNQARLEIYRGLGLKFGMQLWAQQRDHHCHVYTTSCTLIHMQRPLTAHIQYRPKSVKVIDVNALLSPFLSFTSSATCVYSRLPDLKAGLEAITELFTLQSP